MMLCIAFVRCRDVEQCCNDEFEHLSESVEDHGATLPQLAGIASLLPNITIETAIQVISALMFTCVDGIDTLIRR